jgi:drug/metabolite transporter (DMT)-like permease
MIVSGISNQLAFWTAGQLMSGYPMFLLYFCNGIYAFACFVLLAFWQASVGKPQTWYYHFCGTWPQQRYFMIIGVCMGLSLEMQQFANGKVNPDLQSVLYQLFLPATALCSLVWFRKAMTTWQMSGSLLVFAGCLIVIIPGGVTDGNQLIWILVYGFGSLPLGMATVLQEEAFAKFPMTSALQMTAWTTMYAVLFYVLTTPVAMLPGLLYDDSGEGLIFPHGATWAQLWAHQHDAFACFAGHQPLPQHCGERAWLPVVEYSLFYGLNVFSSMWVVKEVDAIFCPIVGSFFVPGVAIASAIPAVLVLFGVSADEVIPITWYVVVGTLVLTLGVLLYQGNIFVERFFQQKDKDNEKLAEAVSHV